MFYFLEKNGKIAEAFPLWLPAAGGFASYFQVVTPVICSIKFKSTTYYLILEWLFRYSFICQGTSIRRQRVTFSVFESSCHLLLPVKPLIGKGNPVKCLAQGHNERTCRPISTLTLLNVERQAGKLWIPTFKVFWSDSARNRIGPLSQACPPWIKPLVTPLTKGLCCLGVMTQRRTVGYRQLVTRLGVIRRVHWKV